MQQTRPLRGKANQTSNGRIEVRESGVHGHGVYATRAIPRGTRIIEYTGKRISWEEGQKQEVQDPEHPHHTFLFGLESGEVIDAASGGNDARWINHSCRPNCEAQEEEGRVFIYALRNLRRGEELFYDYALVPAERRTKTLEKEFGCCCGSAKCRGTMLEAK
jgi:SET domain-containing protein